MPNVAFELNLNKHPKDCKNLSLIDARNVKISNDFSCLQSENSIYEHPIISEYLSNNKVIVGGIPCNTELILFVATSQQIEAIKNGTAQLIEIYRYNEDAKNGKVVYNKLKYFGGIIEGTFTYNINSDLIISFGEYDSYINENVPLKTINLGKYSDETIPDANFNDGKLALVPEVYIPSIGHTFVEGQAYKGWYYFFIRYKIDKNNYTQWYSLGYPIFLCSISKHNIIKYSTSVLTKSKFQDSNYQVVENYPGAGIAHTNHVNLYGASDYFADKNDICQETIKLTIRNLDLNYSNFQIGFINVTSTRNVAYKSIDINVSSNNINYNIDYKNFEEYLVTELISNRYNYYNVKNVINYKNRLYISNYFENKIYNIDTSSIVVKTRTIQPLNEQQEVFKEVIYTEDNQDAELIEYESIATDMGQGINDPSLHAGLFIGSKSSYNYRRKTSTLIPGEIYNFFIHFVDKYGQATQGYRIDNSNANNVGFEVYTNNKGEKCFKVPYWRYGVSNNGKYDYPIFPVTFDLSNFNAPDEYIGCYFSYEKFEKRKITNGLLTLFDFHTGFPTNIDETTLSDKKIVYNAVKANSNPNTNNWVKFFTSDFDIDDLLNLNINKIRVVYKNHLYNDNGVPYYGDSYGPTNNDDFYFTIQPTINISKGEYPSNNNIFPYSMGENITVKEYDIEEMRLCAGGDIKKGRDGLGTCLEIKLSASAINELFGNNTEYDKINIYEAELIKDSDDFYTSNQKVLCKFTNIYYFKDHDTCNVYDGLNGFWTLNNFLVYDHNKYIMDDAKNIVNDINNVSYHMPSLVYKPAKYISTLDIVIPDPDIEYDFRWSTNRLNPLAYIQLPICDDKIREAKQFKVEPEVRYIRVQKINENNPNDIVQHAQLNVVLPINSVNLFEYPYLTRDQSNPKTYTNIIYSESNQIYEFNKRVRRSNIIADESFENSWRQFPAEGYKDISENKGNITKLIVVGLTFLVHTEHSLFMFDRNNVLQTENIDVQLNMPDIFDLDYKEVFSSQLGECGLQDKQSSIVGSYGYIFYDTDAHRFYKFGQGKTEFIDLNIVQFLNSYKPTKVIFADDKESNRLLIHFQIVTNNSENKEYTLSYNYATNTFIAFHDYRFDKAFNTKNILYYVSHTINNVIPENSNIFVINELNNNRNNNFSRKDLYYNVFENIYPGIQNPINSTIQIICNNNYELIKTLEFITYKLYKVNENNNGDFIANAATQRLKKPYSGLKIRIYNDEIDTGELDIEISNEDNKNTSVMNFTKPLWEFGNWNFNYLRNINNSQDNIADTMSRLYGNYFIIALSFGDPTLRCEFETLNYQSIVNPSV